jgi:hypothetical protein
MLMWVVMLTDERDEGQRSGWEHDANLSQQ